MCPRNRDGTLNILTLINDSDWLHRLAKHANDLQPYRKRLRDALPNILAAFSRILQCSQSSVWDTDRRAVL